MVTLKASTVHVFHFTMYLQGNVVGGSRGRYDWNLPSDCPFWFPCDSDYLIPCPSTTCGFSIHLKYEAHFSPNWLFQPAQLHSMWNLHCLSMLPINCGINSVMSEHRNKWCSSRYRPTHSIAFFRVQGTDKNRISWTVSVDSLTWFHLFHWIPAKGLHPDKWEGNSDRALAKVAERWGMWMVRRSLYWG